MKHRRLSSETFLAVTAVRIRRQAQTPPGKFDCLIVLFFLFEKVNIICFGQSLSQNSMKKKNYCNKTKSVCFRAKFISK